MNAVGTNGNRNVGAGIDQETCSHFPVLSQPLDGLYRFPSKFFQFTRLEVLFSKLNEGDSSARGFSDLRQQKPPPGWVVASELDAVGDVVKQTAGSHQPSAYYEVWCGHSCRRNGGYTNDNDAGGDTRA